MIDHGCLTRIFAFIDDGLGGGEFLGRGYKVLKYCPFLLKKILLLFSPGIKDLLDSLKNYRDSEVAQALPHF